MPPTHTTELPITLSDADSALAQYQYATSIDDNTFALATLETMVGSPNAPGVRQTVIRAYSLPSLNILWQADLILRKAEHV